MFCLKLSDFGTDVDPFQANWLPEFNHPHGVLVDTNDFKPEDYFWLFFPNEAFILNEQGDKQVC